MTQPTPYVRGTDFSDYQTAHSSAPFNGANHDSEFDAIKTNLDGINTNLAILQNDDSTLKNSVVHPDALNTATKALIGAGNTGQLNWTPRGAWVTATAYIVGDVVSNSSVTYVCNTAHTSGTFATDLSAGKWTVVFNNTGAAASGVTFTPAGGIAATDVQAALVEVDSEKLAKASNLSDLASAATARTNLAVASTAQLQTATYTYFADSGSADALAITASPVPSAYANGLEFTVKKGSSANATTAPTLDANSLGAKVCFRPDGSALSVGDLAASGVYKFVYQTGFNGGAGGWAVFGVGAQGIFSLSLDITPTQITANQNDYSPSNLASNNVLRMSSDASRNVTGLASGADGRVATVHNVGSFNIVLKSEDTNSSAANRFALFSDRTLMPNRSITLWYDSTSSRWRELSSSNGKFLSASYAELVTSGTGTTDIPFDDTIPQNTEGDEILTLSHTRLSATSYLYVSAKTFIGEDSNTSSTIMIAALFQDSTADAIDVACSSQTSNGEVGASIDHAELILGTRVLSVATGSTTFKLRVGIAGAGAAAAIRWNGLNASRKFGAAMKTFIQVLEIEP